MITDSDIGVTHYLGPVFDYSRSLFNDDIANFAPTRSEGEMSSAHRRKSQRSPAGSHAAPSSWRSRGDPQRPAADCFFSVTSLFCHDDDAVTFHPNRTRMVEAMLRGFDRISDVQNRDVPCSKVDMDILSHFFRREDFSSSAKIFTKRVDHFHRVTEFTISLHISPCTCQDVCV